MPFLADYHRESKRQQQRGRCLHYYDGARCNEIILAHSIQKKGQLSLIAEDRHVYRFSADLSTLQKTGGIPQMKRVGLNKATTFAGFCKHHDNSLFEAIDNYPFEPNKRQAALYSYRCICREYFVKENAVQVLERMRQHSELNAERKSFLRSSHIGHSLGLAGLTHHKSLYEEAFQIVDYDQFEFTCFTSSSPCVISSTQQVLCA